MTHDTTNKRDIRLAGVMGWPVSHSLSPVIHRYWAMKEGRSSYYVPIPVEPTPGALAEALAHARALGFSGFNITLPHKEHALALCDDASPVARMIGAANMISLRKDGFFADNSDARGFADALAGEMKPGEVLRRALVIGAGGAARAIVFALKTIHAVEHVTITNRTRARADDIAQTTDVEVIDWSERARDLEHYDVIVNTTSLGMKGQPPLDLEPTWRPGILIADIVYAPLLTPLLAAAHRTGSRAVDGLSMLMAQAVPGYRSWLGDAALVDQGLRQTVEDAAKAMRGD